MNLVKGIIHKKTQNSYLCAENIASKHKKIIEYRRNHANSVTVRKYTTFS